MILRTGSCLVLARLVDPATRCKHANTSARLNLLTRANAPAATTSNDKERTKAGQPHTQTRRACNAAGRSVVVARKLALLTAVLAVRLLELKRGDVVEEPGERDHPQRDRAQRLAVPAVGQLDVLARGAPVLDVLVRLVRQVAERPALLCACADARASSAAYPFPTTISAHTAERNRAVLGCTCTAGARALGGDARDADGSAAGVLGRSGRACGRRRLHRTGCLPRQAA